MSKSKHFQLCRNGSSWVEPVLKAVINVSCSKTQHSAAGEALNLLFGTMVSYGM